MVILRHQDLNRLEKYNGKRTRVLCHNFDWTPQTEINIVNIIQRARSRSNILELEMCDGYSADIPPLINIEASACRLAMTGHGTLIIVSVYLPPHKPLLRSDIETLLALGMPSSSLATLTKYGLAYKRRHRPNILDLAILKGVVLSLNSIETVHCLGSDHLPVLLKLGSSTGENPNIATKTIIDWKRVSTALEEVDTPNLVIPDDIVSNNDIDTAIGALTTYRSVVKRCQRFREFRSPGPARGRSRTDKS
ncbi:hypothetical protein EVAR_85403_1 [Eumeta japonica]|uniref:RNA-directed DNA polymerase from mobile element jockey n=1 Tax=Eumeta variegata TaxID=151549 RepID=A0A4C1SJK4_EUMVA|nr:hypothetical protein EVAR_85403_1 [Eumeta japonica]